ncbi:MAG TPA: DPP IV N-terminal domain-containing protein [Thermoanaerobaculia bacterium]|nr:DPP IV N-terminal domain-containing protein [Thermoanaerobaculia bacterium]
MILPAPVLAAVLAAAPAVSAPAPAKKPLTLEKVAESRMPATVYAWRDASHVVWTETEGQGADASVALWQAEVATGKRTKLLDAPAVKDRDGKEKKLPLRGAVWTPKGDAFAVPFDHDLWLVGLSGEAKRLTDDAEDETLATWSPDGTRLAYVKKHDLWVVDAASRKETRLTKTGTDAVLNGVLDWVYGEELAGRGHNRSFFWSPDSAAIAYLSLDQARVPTYPIVDFTPLHGAVEAEKYPQPGDPASIPSVHVVDLAGNETAAFAPPPEDVYVTPEMSWTQDGKSLCFLLLDRSQTHLGVFLLPRAGGEPKKLLEESDPAWINSIEPPHFLKDGSFVFRSERSGFLHLYRHAANGSVKNAITKGDWMVDGPFTVDEKMATVWFRATTKDPRERQVFVAKLDGSSMVQVTGEPGVHSPSFSPGNAFFVDTFSSAAAPPKSVVRSVSGSVAAVLTDKPHPLAEYDTGTVELGSFTGADGTVFYTRLAKPSNFDAARKYPVVVVVYGGPHAQLVQNAWTSGFDAYLASRGFLVWSMDNRGSWGRGHAFEAAVLKNLGAQELKDQLEGVAELAKRPYVDAARVGITGWSYGGYMTLYAATHAGATFKCAAAGAPVVDWTLYDSIYTERYMKTPKENPGGYKSSSPFLAAKDLGTKLLILHGTSDDNVHMQNTMKFIDELMKARKDFVFVPLPRQMHGPRAEAALYTNQRLAEWFEENLLAP